MIRSTVPSGDQLVLERRVIFKNFLHPSGVRVTLSGRPGDDAKRYQEQEVAQRTAAARSAKGDKT